MHFSEKLWKMWENIEMFNLSQQEKEEAIYVRTKWSCYKVFHRTPINNGNEKKRRYLWMNLSI